MNPRFSFGLAAVLLAFQPALARADVPPPPTFIGDSIYLPFPANLIVAAALFGAVVTGYFTLRRWHVRKVVAIPLCIGFLIAANMAIYDYARRLPRPRPGRPLPPIPKPYVAPAEEWPDEEP